MDPRTRQLLESGSALLSSIGQRRASRAASKRRPWNEADVRTLAARYPHEPSQALADALGRDIKSVYSKAHQLGLKKSAAFLASEKSGRISRINDIGAKSRFQKGQKPWNKGRHYHAGGRSAETQFKPGNQPHTWLPIGSHRLTKDGYLQRKISNTPGPNHLRWRSVHELVWIDANGPVPDGHVVVFKPGCLTTDADQITIEKVECIDRAELMRRNTIHNYPDDIVSAVRAKAVLMRRINKLEKSREKQD